MSTSIDVEWSAIVGATEYKLSWNTGDLFHHFLLLYDKPLQYVCLLMCFANFPFFKALYILLSVMLAENSAPQFQYLDHTVLSHQITDLNPQSVYTITICAVYGNSEGPEISLSQLTGIERKVIYCFVLGSCLI